MDIKMTSLGSAFEASLRILLLLFAKPSLMTSEERMCMLDYMTVYANDFGFSIKNLHGHGPYRFSEYPQRRIIIRKALRELVLDQFVTAIETENGFCYRISKAGLVFCNELISNYAEDYIEAASIVIEKTASISDENLMSKINGIIALYDEGDGVI